MNQCDVPDTFLTSCFLTRGHKLLSLVPRLPQLSSTLFCHANIREGNFFESQTSTVPTHPPPPLPTQQQHQTFFVPRLLFSIPRLLEKLVTALLGQCRTEEVITCQSLLKASCVDNNIGMTQRPLLTTHLKR